MKVVTEARWYRVPINCPWFNHAHCTSTSAIATENASYP